MPAGLCPAASLADIAAWLRYGATLLTFRTQLLNHAAVSTVTAFMTSAAQAGVTIPVIASVAAYTDAPSAAVLSGLPGLELDPDVVRGVVEDRDPVAAGLTAAVREARALLDVPGVAGVNISGVASARGYEFAAEVKAELARLIREERADDQRRR